MNRILAHVPGVTTRGTVSDNTLIVQGGTAQENAYLVNGIEINNINHFSTYGSTEGAIGFINTDLIRSVDFYAGGIPASTPPYLSSITDISLRDGADCDRSNKFNLDLSGFGGTMEGSFPSRKLSYVANARWNDMTLLKQFITNCDVLRFGDGLANIVLNQDDHHAVDLLGIGSYDLNRTTPFYYGGVDSSVSQKEVLQGAVGLSSSYVKPGLSNKLTLSFASVDHTYFQKYIGSDSVFVSLYDLPQSRSFWTEVDKRNHVNLKNDVSLHKDSTYSLDIGLNGMYTNYYARHQEGPVDHDSAVDGVRLGGYIQASLQRGYVCIEGGLRDDYYTLVKGNGLSPHLGMAISPPGWGTLTMNGGLSYQLPGEIDQYLWDFIAPYDNVPIRLRDVVLQRCWEGGATYERPLWQSTVARAEAFYKWYDRQFPPSQPIAPHVRDYTEVVDGTEQWRITDQHGQKRAYGVDLDIKSDARRVFYYDWYLSLSKVSERYRNGRWYNGTDDIPLLSRLMLGFTIAGHHRVAGCFSVTQGRPYSKQIPDSAGNYCTERFPTLFLVNVRYNFDHEFKKCRLGIYLEIMNLLNQRPIVYTEWYGSQQYVNQRMNGILPIIGMEISF